MSKKLILSLIALFVFLSSSPVFSQDAPPNTFVGIRGKSWRWAEVDELYNLKVSLGTPLAGEDVAADRLKVEQRFSYDGNITADKQIKSAPGFVHNLVCIGTDADATAGSIILYDNTAESGTIIFSWAVLAVAYSQPVIIPLDVVASVGLYLGFTTTADVTCTVSYR